VQLVIFLPTFNTPYMRPKIRCDGESCKIFEISKKVNTVFVKMEPGLDRTGWMLFQYPNINPKCKWLSAESTKGSYSWSHGLQAAARCMCTISPSLILLRTSYLLLHQWGARMVCFSLMHPRQVWLAWPPTHSTPLSMVHGEEAAAAAASIINS
jgi:hypothetical protein